MSDHLARRSRLMQNRGITVVLDVGANRGQYGSSLRDSVGFTGRIVSFEPLAEEFRELESLAARDGNWTCHKIALGDSEGADTINVSANSFSSSILPVNEAALAIEPSIGYVRREPVTVRRLDTLFESLVGPADIPFLKVDTQGYDMKVVAGAGKMLERIPLIQLETSFFAVYRDEPLVDQVIGTMRDLGYRVVSFEPGWEDPRTAEMLQADLVFAR